MAISLQFDVAEPRVLRDRLVAPYDGATYDQAASSANIWLDPATLTTMLRPLPTQDAWSNTFSGSYARFQKSDYTLTTPAAWENHHVRATGDIHLYGLGTNERVTTAASYAANRGWYASWFVPGTATDLRVGLDIGFGTWGAASTVSLRFRANGETEVWKGNVFQKSYRPEREGLRPIAASASPQAGQYVAALIIPTRFRSLLVITTAGVQFEHVFTDLAPVGPNTITPTGPVWWQVPQGQASVQLAPIRYVTSGYALSQIITFRYAPPLGATFVPLDAIDDTEGGGSVSVTWSLVAPDGTPFVPNGINRQCRVKAALATSDPFFTPFVFAGDLILPRTRTTTDGSTPVEIGVGGYLRSLEMTVPEDGAATLQFSAGLDKLATSGLTNMVRVGDRPIRLAVDGQEVFRGTASLPDFDWARLDTLREVNFHAADRTVEFAYYTFADSSPYDGLLFTDAISDLFELPGFDTATEADISADTFALPITPAVSRGEYQFLPDLGEGEITADAWIDRLHNEFAATWQRGWRPTADGYKWWFKKPEDLPSAPAIVLYKGKDSAIAAGVAGNLVSRRTVRDGFVEHRFAPEVNQIQVVGLDSRANTYIFSQFDDAGSQNPQTAPVSRPDNWRGRTVRMRYHDPAITTQDAADRARDILSARLTGVRREVELNADFLFATVGGVPVWRGDIIRLMGYAEAPNTYTDWRVLEFSVSWETNNDFAPVRHARYRCEFVAEGGAP